MPYDFPTTPATGTVVTVPDGSYRVWDSQKWRAAPSSNAIIPPTGFLQLIGGTLTGALSISPPGPMSFLPGVSQQNPIFMSKTSWTGTTARTGQFGYMNWIDIVSDDAFLDDSGASAFRITHNYGGGTQFAGGRVGMSVTMYQVTGATGTFPKDTNQQRIAIQAQVHAAENASGTSSTDPAGVSGSIYSIAGYTRLFGPGSVVDGQGVSHPVSGATNYNDCIGMNMNMRVETGASCYAKEFIHLAQEFQDQTQGSVSDACIMIANQPGAIGWKNIMALGRPNGAWPLSLDGTGKVFGTYRGTGLARMQAGYGIDWRDISFNTAAIATPGFVVDGFGNTGISALSLATSGQTTTVDANRIHVLSATVVTSTGTWGPSMGMYDASGNQWAVGTTDASRNLLTVTLVAPAYITGAPPANPVTVIANSGPAAQATLNLTWSTAPGALSIQPSGGATVFGGPVTLPAAGTGLTVTNNATVGGVLTVGAAASTTDETIQIMSTAGHNRLLNIYNGSLLRWGIGADVTAENGSNTGSLFQIATYNDAGGFVGALVKGSRGSGPGGTGGPYISTMRPYVMPTPRATVPGGVVGNDRTFPTAGVDVQPITTLGTDPLSVTSGSAVVNITWTGCGAAGGVFQAGLTECYVNLLGATATGGITPTGWLRGTRVDNNTFSITWTSNATSTATGGGTAVTVQPNFSSITEKVYSTLTAGTAGFPMQSQRLFVANPAFYKVIGGGGGAGPQFQQEWRQVFTPNDTSGLNDWGLAATELDLVNRGPDTGYNPNLFIAKNLTVGIWTGALGVSPMPAYAPGGGVATNWNTVFGIFASKNAANYVGYSVQPNALVGQTLDTVTSHGGVAFVAFGSHSLINAFNYTNGSSVITVTLQTASALTRQVNGNSVYIPTVQTVGGVTFGGASYVIAGVTATTFTIIGTGTAGSTGSLAVSQWAAFANLVPYAPMDLQGSWKHGLTTTNFRSEDGSIINTQPGNGLLWGDGTGTASINSSVSTAGNINVILAPAGTGAVMVAGAAGPTITSGSGVPASTQPRGSLYCRTGGGVATTLYVSQGAGTWNAVAGV